MKVIAVIPARYGSTRFPGKVLASDTGKFLVQHTSQRALSAGTIQEVIIATDDDRVMEACSSFTDKFGNFNQAKTAARPNNIAAKKI